VALPLLDAMIPASTALAADGREARRRGIGFIYFPHGAIIEALVAGRRPAPGFRVVRRS
jgi:hypothetical protein